MAKKSEKRKTLNYMATQKQGEMMLKNPTPEVAGHIAEYITWQVLYLNDTACNAVKFLGDELKTVGYRGNGAQTLYRAAMKRVDEYFSLVYSLDIDKEYLADMFGEMDEYMDSPIYRIREEICGVLERNGVDNPHWIASVETARLLTSYSTFVSKLYIEKFQHCAVQLRGLWRFRLTDLEKVMTSMFQFVESVSNLKDSRIDLNKEEKVLSAFHRFTKAFRNPDNFSNASQNAAQP